MTQTGKLEQIWIKRFKGGPMDIKNSARLHAGIGLEGNANQRGKRQVTIISKERWQQIEDKFKTEIDPSARRANLLISGINLTESRGRILQVGHCCVKIWGETRPCELMDAAFKGLKDALKENWGGGVFGEILDDGIIEIGNTVHWVDSE